MELWLASFLELLSLPQYSLSTVLVVSFLSATLLPMGSEPLVFGVVKLNPGLMWQVIAVATVGNTLGGALNWWIGFGARRLAARRDHAADDKAEQHRRAAGWLHRFGPKACLLSWLPLVGDPLCAVAGWLRLPFWPCVGYMAVGKLLRYVVMTGVLLAILDAWPFLGGLWR